MNLLSLIAAETTYIILPQTLTFVESEQKSNIISTGIMFVTSVAVRSAQLYKCSSYTDVATPLAGASVFSSVL